MNGYEDATDCVLCAQRVGEALVRVPASRWDDIVELVR